MVIRVVPPITKIRYRVAIAVKDGRMFKWPVFTDAQHAAAVASPHFVDWERPWVEMERRIIKAED